MTDKKTGPKTYMDFIAENPNGFLRTTEVWCVLKPIEGKPEEAYVVKYDEPSLVRSYPADASFISKIVLAKGANGEKIMCMAATGLHDILHLIEVVRTMDFEKVKWSMGHDKAEFGAPAIQKYAYIIRVKPDETDAEGKVTKRGDTEAHVHAPTNLVDMDGEMIMMESHEGIEPDWVYNWSFISTREGVHIVALTAGGKLLELVNDRSMSRRYKNITPPGVGFINDVVTIPRANGEVDFVLATPYGIVFRNNAVMGTGTHDICNLCYDTDTQALWIRTKDNKVFRLWLEGGRFVTPEAWSNVPLMFQDAVSHKLLCGSGVPSPILTAWSRPREIMTKDPGTNEDTGTGKFSIAYHHMEVAKTTQPPDSKSDDKGDKPQATVC